MSFPKFDDGPDSLVGKVMAAEVLLALRESLLHHTSIAMLGSALSAGKTIGGPVVCALCSSYVCKVCIVVRTAHIQALLVEDIVVVTLFVVQWWASHDSVTVSHPSVTSCGKASSCPVLICPVHCSLCTPFSSLWGMFKIYAAASAWIRSLSQSAISTP